MYQAGLILEGGGMKGLYTAGVIDFFLDKGIAFSSVYGVSAGACTMCSYLSKQRGRARDVCIDYLGNRRYCSLESLLTTGDLFNAQMNYQLVPEYLNPYDYEAFQAYGGKAYSVATDIRTGKPVYFRIRDMRKDISKIRASASLPLVSRNVKIDGGLYLDGGLSDSIPIQKSVIDGNRKNVVVMTKEAGFVRRRAKGYMLWMLRARYWRYPKVAELMARRYVHYNEQVAYVERLKASGQVFLLRPRAGFSVKRVEQDADKLRLLYRQGYEDAAARYEELLDFLSGEEKSRREDRK
ncbi:MAG: patatin family protein [Lachnospiraceae bacterium]|uniref:patatin-like phospholipase family protein n=1 Tax=uncultured Acetatifactor sp. TaxID=1671927 RepID=UPI0026066A3B|nr:patatin family protein [uncultured Acetatifactor sp.]MCI8790508.1 patatin family protein [Lachnospiraceae bacterium]